MPEHAHLVQTKHVDRGWVEVSTVVRRQYVEAEEAIARDLGYAVETRYCGDSVCLGPEPEVRSRGRA